jgi:hypothetical protein
VIDLFEAVTPSIDFLSIVRDSEAPESATGTRRKLRRAGAAALSKPGASVRQA